MKYTDFEKRVAFCENQRYEARLDRAQNKVNEYMHKNRVHVFDKEKKKDVAQIHGKSQGLIFQDLIPKKLSELISEYAHTPVDQRGTEQLSDDDQKHNIQK